MLDVVEHMEHIDGLEAITAALMAAPRVILYMPHGFVPQYEDNWGTGQNEWQRHRSGWRPHQFPGWTIIEGKEGFAAIHGDVQQ
jgi:hypothetical protein